jgi:hypothetical protein
MRINNKNKNTFTLDGKEIGNVAKFPYIGNIVTEEGGSMGDVSNKISKANGAFNQLQKVWKPSDTSLRTKRRIFRTRVEAGSNTSTVTLRAVTGDEIGLKKRPRHSLSG